MIGMLLMLAACNRTDPTPSRLEPTPLVLTVAQAEVVRGDMKLGATADSAEVIEGEIIEITATLESSGTGPLDLTGSGSGPIFFSVTRLDDGLSSGPPGSRGDCEEYVLLPDEPLMVPFAKSGGFSPDDPDADFMEAYFADPELTLPPGTWRIDVTALGNIGRECGGDELIDLAVELVVFVAQEGG